VLGDAVAFEGVSKYPARIKCALLGWMAWKDATGRALDGPAGGNPADGKPAGGTPADGDQAREQANGQAGNGRRAAAAAREQT